MGAQSQAVQTSGWIPGGWGGQGEVHKTIALNWALGKWREVGVCMCVVGGGVAHAPRLGLMAGQVLTLIPAVYPGELGPPSGPTGLQGEARGAHNQRLVGWLFWGIP